MVKGCFIIVLLAAMALNMFSPMTPAFGEPANKKVAVVFEEQVRGVFGLSGSWVDAGRAEEVLIDKLSAAGYQVVDAQLVRAQILRDQAVQVLSGDQKAAVAVGARLDAPLIVVGKGYAKSSGNVVGSSMKSNQGQVSLRLLDAQNGEVLTSVSASATKPHVDEVAGGTLALEAASGEASDKLLGAMAEIETGKSTGLQELNVSISGMRSYRHYAFVQEWIEKNIAGFQKIESQEYTAGSAQMAITCTATGHEFAKQIALAKFEGFSINPLDVNDRSVTLKVIIHEP